MKSMIYLEHMRTQQSADVMFYGLACAFSKCYEACRTEIMVGLGFMI